MFDEIKKGIAAFRHDARLAACDEPTEFADDIEHLVRMVEGFAEVFEDVGACDKCPVWKSGCNGDCAINILHYINAQARKGVSE